MKLSRVDLPLLQGSLVTFVVAVTLVLLALWGSDKYVDKAALGKLNAQSQLKDARDRLAAAQDDHVNIDTFAEEYSALKHNRIIGDEPRLDWIEGMEYLRQQNLVPGFRYTIAPQKKYTPPSAIDSGNFDIHYSEMKLQFDLLHEGQLLDFLSALRSQVKGWYLLENCSIQRAAPTNESTTQLKAECGGGWITLKNRNEPG